MNSFVSPLKIHKFHKSSNVFKTFRASMPPQENRKMFEEGFSKGRMFFSNKKKRSAASYDTLSSPRDDQIYISRC